LDLPSSLHFNSRFISFLLFFYFFYLFFLFFFFSPFFFFFFNDPATTEIYTLSLHDALPIYSAAHVLLGQMHLYRGHPEEAIALRSEEHTSELQSRGHLVCRLLLEKKKQQNETARVLFAVNAHDGALDLDAVDE